MDCYSFVKLSSKEMVWATIISEEEKYYYLSGDPEKARIQKQLLQQRLLQPGSFYVYHDGVYKFIPGNNPALPLWRVGNKIHTLPNGLPVKVLTDVHGIEKYYLDNDPEIARKQESSLPDGARYEYHSRYFVGRRINGIFRPVDCGRCVFERFQNPSSCVDVATSSSSAAVAPRAPPPRWQVEIPMEPVNGHILYHRPIRTTPASSSSSAGAQG